MCASRITARLRDRDIRRRRSQNDRIRRLLSSEYCEFSETILVESPFAETARNGRGLRQVALALTPTKLIVAADVLQTNPGFLCPSGVDTSIESFELVSVYPLEYVTLSVFRRRQRRTLKARFISGRVNYYELGGAKRKTSWKIWCEQVRRLLARKVSGSSLSETTAASSSSSSTLYLLSSEIEVKDRRDAKYKKPVFRIWTRYGGAGDCVTSTWTDKDLYLGPSFNDLRNGNYMPAPLRFAGASLEELKHELRDRCTAFEKSCRSLPYQTQFGGQAKSQRPGGLCNVLFARNRNARRVDCAASCKSSFCTFCQPDGVDVNAREKHGRCHECPNILFEEELKERVEKEYEKLRQHRKESSVPLAMKISRFGFGVSEKCYSELILGPYRGEPGYTGTSLRASRTVDPYELLESGVTVWENSGEDRCRASRSQRHRRRYGFASAVHFFHAFGPWSVQPGERDSVQTLGSSSAVNICKQPSDAQLRLPVSRRQLTASVSCAALTASGGSSIVGVVARGRVMLFWTPEYWYRPQAAATAYRELRHHLASIQDFRREKEKQTKKKFVFCGRRGQASAECSGTTGSIVTGKSSSLLERVLSINGAHKRGKNANEHTDIDKGIAQLRGLLRMSIRITAWDLDSTTLATQLTMIDRDLFVRIPATEIEVLIHQRSSRNAPNLGAWIAFSHRIACLTASEILAVQKIDARTRIMARFINAADKCFELRNFQSCRSILAGLQAPPIYRLQRSWSYLRTHHATRYALMEKLSKIYKNPRGSKYRRAWAAAKRSPPYMPYVDHFLLKVLGLNDTGKTGENVVPSTKKGTIVQTVDATKSLSFNDSPNDLSADGRGLIESKRCLARRIFTATLAKVKFTTCRNVADEVCEGDVSTCKQRYLARKFFHRWNAIVSESRKLREENERKWRNTDWRRKRALDAAVWLTDCQRFAQGYDYPTHSFACEFLLKARYREDRENFFISLKLEPPRLS